MVRLSVQRLWVNIPTVEEDGVQSHVDGTGNVRVVVVAYHNGRLAVGTGLGKGVVEELLARLVGPGILTENDGREIALNPADFSLRDCTSWKPLLQICSR